MSTPYRSQYPKPSNHYLPKMYFVGLFVGSRGTGKTYAITKLLKMYESSIIDPVDGNTVGQRVILMSPTSEANPVFKSLKYLDDSDVINDYSDDKLMELLKISNKNIKQQ